MGRPRKQTADFFPHYVQSSRTKFILEDGWGNDGYAFWFKLLEILCRSDGHSYDCSVTANKKYLVAFTKLDEEKVDAIITTLTDLGNIDKELWEKHKIIWCQSLVDNLQTLYAKRTVSAPVKPFSVEFSGRKLPGNYPEKRENEPEAEQESPAEPAPKKKKTTRKKPEVEKIQYAQYVHMTEKEYQQLIATYGEEKTKRMIEKLDNYKGSKGKTYKNDYRAILSWVADEVNREFEQKGGGNYGRYANNRGNTQQPAADPGGFKPSGGFKNNGQ